MCVCVCVSCWLEMIEWIEVGADCCAAAAAAAAAAAVLWVV